MGKPITIWQLGNTGLRNPMRIWEGLKLFAESPFNGNLRGSNEERFQTLLNHAGLVNSTGEAEDISSYARKWRLMFARFGFIYPQVKKKDGKQEDLGPQDLVTPFGETFLKADTYPAQQECFLRSLSLEQTKVPGDLGFFSPLRWILAVMLELEKRTGTSEISRIEFSLWGHTTDPSYDINDVVNHIIDLRERRKKATAKRRFDADEIKKRGQDYNKKSDNFTDYSDMNMRYLRISGIVQRKGRGLVIVPAKHFLAEKLASTTLSRRPIMDVYKELCHGASLPMDDLETAKALLLDMEAQLKKNHVYYDLGNRPVSTVPEINAARLHLEELWQKTDEINYAAKQPEQWQEISDYMTLLIKGGGKKIDDADEDNGIEVPKDETPAYLEWVLWRAALAFGNLVNHPSDMRGFRLDSDFLPVSAAGGRQGDLYCEYDKFTILTEVTMSTGSRQESMEGEPVRRHVSEAVLKYGKNDIPVYGLFIAVKIDTNTAETFRHGVWYAKGDVKQRLDILPLTLAQFQKCFIALFQSNESAKHEKIKELIEVCEAQRDLMEAPAWKKYIDQTVESII